MGKHLASLTKGFGGVVVRPLAFHFKGRGFDSQSGFLNVTRTPHVKKVKVLALPKVLVTPKIGQNLHTNNKGTFYSIYRG